MATVRSRREPTAIKVTQMSSMSKDDAELVLTAYLEDVKDRNVNGVNQLLRVQRDLRGLPPVLEQAQFQQQTSDIGSGAGSSADIPVYENELDQYQDQMEVDNVKDTEDIEEHEKNQETEDDIEQSSLHSADIKDKKDKEKKEKKHKDKKHKDKEHKDKKDKKHKKHKHDHDHK